MFEAERSLSLAIVRYHQDDGVPSGQQTVLPLLQSCSDNSVTTPHAMACMHVQPVYDRVKDRLWVHGAPRRVRVARESSIVWNPKWSILAGSLAVAAVLAPA